MQVITEASLGQFDPGLLTAFEKCSADFERIHREVTE
jgi:hypothetical protein